MLGKALGNNMYKANKMKAGHPMDQSFLEQDTVLAAEQLIGSHLIRQTNHGTIRIQITETEAYRGSDDAASHAYRGVTPRNQLMFSDVGRLYVYFIYGMHFCMNIVAHKPGEVGAILLRAGLPLEGIELIRANRPGVPDRNLLNGPGKLAKALDIDASFNGYDLLQLSEERRLFLELHKPVGSIQKTARIGITKGTELLWRFLLTE
jgi:DNA-3-methyladenine glycosylase